jgi:hypothetical protein
MSDYLEFFVEIKEFELGLISTKVSGASTSLGENREEGIAIQTLS